MNDIRRQTMAQQPDFDPEAFNTPEFRQNVLDGMINQQLILDANDKLGVVISGDMIKSQIATMPVFQLEGRFDADTYRAVLAQQGMTPLGFQERVRQDLAVQVLPQAVVATAIVTDAEVDRYLSLRDQTRDVRYIELPQVSAPDSEVAEAEIQAWYEDHQDEFMNPEQVSLAYLEVSADALETDVTPSEEALRTRYETEQSRFSVPEQRLVSHILVAVPQDAAPDAQKAALAEARDIEAKLAAGGDFAELAGEYSDDLGSSRQGGDLGWIEKGMTNAAFEEAAFALAKGAVSEPVLSSEGYHIIKVGDIRPGHTKPFEEVRDEVASELLESERERKFSDVAGRLIDLIYANPSTLDDAAGVLGLEIKRTGLFTRAGGSGIAANPQVVETAFSEQVLTQGMNSDRITLGPNHIAVVRVAEHKPATAKPLAEVRDEVRDRILAEQAARQAAQESTALLAQLRESAGALDDIATDHGVEVVEKTALERFDAEVPPALLEAIFKMPHPQAENRSVTAVELAPSRYALVVLDAVNPGDPASVPEAERESIAMQLRQLHGIAGQQALLDVLRGHADVVIRENVDLGAG